MRFDLLGIWTLEWVQLLLLYGPSLVFLRVLLSIALLQRNTLLVFDTQWLKFGSSSVGSPGIWNSAEQNNRVSRVCELLNDS